MKYTITAKNNAGLTSATLSIRIANTTAQRVYGQLGNFASGAPNFGGLSASSLNIPMVTVSDGAGVYICDQLNNRVLFFAGTDTVASRVYGQNDSLTANAANNGGLSASSLSFPSGLALDASGLYIADGNNHRVLYFENIAL